MKRFLSIVLSWVVGNCMPAMALSVTPASVWVDSVMSTLSDREMIAQLFVPRLDLTDNTVGFAQLKEMVVKSGIGGILLGKGTCTSYANLINYVQAEAKIPLLVTLDGEWGPAMRVTDAPRFPYNMALGAMRDTKLAYDFGKEVARECRALGIQVDFAPVLDVNTNPRNPVIGQRSFGENPYKVAQLGSLFCQGLEDGGVMAVGKHFPGHGDTSVDSHKALPTVTRSREQIDKVDLLPYREAIRMGMSGIMVGHLNIPALDASGTPASLSCKITTGLLKTELGFDGLIFTDALAMSGAVAKPGENNCVSAFIAGADIMLSSRSPIVDMEAMYKALMSGKISHEELDKRCRRVLMAKYRLGLSQRPAPASVARVKELVNSPAAYDLIDRISRAAITAVCDSSHLLPIRNLASNSISVINIGDKANNAFTEMCSQYAQVLKFGTVDGSLSSATVNAILNSKTTVIALYSSESWAVSLYHCLSKAPNCVSVFFMNPYKMSVFGIDKSRQAVVVAYGNQSSLQKAAAQAIFGGLDVNGRLPVNVPGVADEGTGVDIKKIRLGYASLAEENMNPNLETVIDSIVDVCIATHAFPGCQVAVVKNGNFVINKAYGHLTYQKDSPAVTDSTIYDLASLTKPLATTAVLMSMYDKGTFLMNDSIGKFVPELVGTDKSRLSVMSLLNHNSGLGSIGLFNMLYGVKYSKNMLSRLNKMHIKDKFASKNKSERYDTYVSQGLYVSEELKDSILMEIANFQIKKKGYKYSDLNFVLLNYMITNLSGVNLDTLSRQLYSDIGAWRTGFMPLNRFGKTIVAPTEYDDLYRHTLVQGTVHDELAAFSGGIQGNAGLFSNATDVAKLCQVWLNKGFYGGTQVFSSSTVNLFTSTISNAQRLPGFDTAARNKSMSDMSQSIYGHTGFTGTAFWIDPDKNLIYVFLSNKIYPERDNKVFSELNPRVAILREIYKNLRR